MIEAIKCVFITHINLTFSPRFRFIYLFRHKTLIIKNINKEKFKFKYTFVTAGD